MPPFATRRIGPLLASVLLVGAAVALLCWLWPRPAPVGHRRPSPSNAERPASGTAAGMDVRLAVPSSGAYTGAYVDFGANEDDVTLEAIEGFDELVGRRQAIIAFSSDWGKGTFPRRQLQVVENYGAVPLVYWLPWDRELGLAPSGNRFALERILAGEWDAYVDRWAVQAREFGRPMLVSWGLEPNGNWFPWSGVFNGGCQPAPGDVAATCAGPERYRRAYRRVVDRVRAAGARNIEWVWHGNNTSDPDVAWNEMRAYYPGAAYADWLGISAYGTQYPNAGWAPFDVVFPEPYRRLAALDPAKPLLLAEWGVGEFPKAGNKAEWIAEFFRRLPTECPRLRGIVFWHERWQNADLSYSNLRVNSSPGALEAYRRGIASAYWLDRPRFVGR